MTIMEWLKQNKENIRYSEPLNFRDIIDHRSIYFGMTQSYEHIAYELMPISHVTNARYIGTAYDENDVKTILYMKEHNEYTDFELRSFAQHRLHENFEIEEYDEGYLS